MRTKDAPWNLNNKNVLILFGKVEEEFALKYGIAICDNEMNLVPCKYIAFYSDETIGNLFEITKAPLDNVNPQNTNEIKDIIGPEGEKGRKWFGDRESCRMFVIKKISDVGPVINDYIAPSTGKLTPLTWGTPRYTTYDRIKTAKLTSELQCIFDEEEYIPPPVVEVEEDPAPVIVEKKNNMPFIIGAIVGAIAIAVILFLVFKPEPEVEVKEKVVIKEVPVKEIPQIVFGGNFFATGASDIRKESIPYLNDAFMKLKKIFAEYDNVKVIIIGHTDNLGNEEDNKKLSAARAKAVMDWLINKGLDASKLSFEGKGSAEPLADNSTEEGRSQNRRTEIKIVENK